MRLLAIELRIAILLMLVLPPQVAVAACDALCVVSSSVGNCGSCSSAGPCYCDKSKGIYESNDPICNPANTATTGVVLCDGFEDSIWYRSTADYRVGCGTPNGCSDPDNDGWCGNIYGTSHDCPEPGTGTLRSAQPANTDAVVCSGGGLAGTNCAATSDNTGTLSGNMASHNLASSISNMWFRYYYKPHAGMIWGQHKAMTFNKDDAGSGGLWFINDNINCGAGNASSPGSFALQVLPNGFTCSDNNCSDDVCDCDFCANASGITLTGGNCYYIEQHLVLNTPVNQADGVWDVWINNCGADCVTNCVAGVDSPTHRRRISGIKFNRASGSVLIKQLWLQAESNDIATDTSGVADVDEVVIRNGAVNNNLIGFVDIGGGGQPAPGIQLKGIRGGGLRTMLEHLRNPFKIAERWPNKRAAPEEVRTWPH